MLDFNNENFIKTMKTLIVIPSRFGSSRFEGKPLVEIGGISLVKRTYLQALKTNLDATVVVATEDQRIFDHVSEFGQCVMTSKEHQSGTDRCFEVIEKMNQPFEYLINLQGDEPFILPEQIELIQQGLSKHEAEIVTLKKRMTKTEDILNPNMVKLVSDINNNALYFSRHPIPYFRGKTSNEWVEYHTYFRHIGIYGFKTSIISKLKDLKVSKLELCESLEQLRWLENGFKINVLETHFISPAIDTPEDLKEAEAFLRESSNLK